MRPGLQGLIHLGVIVAALLLLPITMGPEWKPADSSHPTLRILLLLGANVGVPYFLLSSTGPLVQARRADLPGAFAVSPVLVLRTPVRSWPC